MSDIFGKDLSEPSKFVKHYQGKEYTYKKQNYQLIRMEEGFVGIWSAIQLPNFWPAQLYLIPHPPTRRWQEDNAEAGYRDALMGTWYSYVSPDYSEVKNCPKDCAFKKRHKYTLSRPEGQDHWPSFHSQLCPGHQAMLTLWLEKNPTNRMPTCPSDTRQVSEGNAHPQAPDRMSLLLEDPE